ncbi:hypothetical protein GPECTOR_51g706 [Gonium pectorale]|uniref:MRH domain-containing protein n=1 Tax=Gonium pectorale TaxID=33097 RepID=A0A150G8N1_GONPE|nr:hypothetical protein GPECTOR_51g706 [Gonium pectorale]|eukprot:KXZ45720.1 hypothetical protein GPECTOR_51g706 [Gonium pectorale]
MGGGSAAGGEGGGAPAERLRAADVLGLLLGRPQPGIFGSGGGASTCLYRQEGLWTYEMCYKKHVRQFRNDGGGKNEDFICGKYSGDEVQSQELKADASSSPVPIRYVSHVFGDGADCVMTGGPRSAEVRFTCMPDTSENAIVSIREFPTCNYVMTVSTPFLCNHPDFKPPPENRIHTVCEPLEETAANKAAAAAADEGEGAPPSGSRAAIPGGGGGGREPAGHGSEL